MVVQEGEVGSSMYIIETGPFKVSNFFCCVCVSQFRVDFIFSKVLKRDVDTGGEQTVTNLERGQCFGEVILV